MRSCRNGGDTMQRSLFISAVVAAVLAFPVVRDANAQPPGGPGTPDTGGPPGGARTGRGGFGQNIPIGPAAPVPPEVAILRPSAEEVSQMNDELDRLVDSDHSVVKPLFEK